MKEVPVFIFNGLLESGKTTMINRFLDNPQMSDGKKKILLITCEEGIEEYDPDRLQKKNVIQITAEEENQFNAAFLAEQGKKEKPDLVVIEYNGMWKASLPLEIKYPSGWSVAEVMTTIDSSTFDSYINNMRSIMLEHYKVSDIVVFNRFQDKYNKIGYRSLIKAVKMNTQVVYEYEDGTLDTEFDGSPFDLTQDQIHIEDSDFGIWYFDAMDSAGKYDGKTVDMRAVAVKMSGTKMKGFLIGRFAMTCCAKDIQFLSIYCRNDMKFKNKAWYNITAKAVCVDSSVYGEESGDLLPALEVITMTPADKPEQEIVTF